MTVDFQTFSDNELEKTTFEAAENYFLKGEMKKAQRAINSYFERYPNGRFSIAANFFLAEIYFFEKEWDLALKSYLDIINLSVNDYTEKALVRSTQILLNQNKLLM